LETRLKDLIPDRREKAQIAEVTRSWITQLMNEGFSAGSIFYSVAQRFFSVDATPKIADVSALNKFFESFGAEPSGWEVTFKVSPSFKRLEAVARELSISLDEKAPPTKSKTPYTREKVFRERNPKGLLFATISDVKARDVVKARDRAEDQLRTVASLGYLHAHRLSFDWEPDALVYNIATKWVTHLDQPTPHVLKRPDCPEDMLGTFAGETYGILDRASFDVPSTIRLSQVLDLHAAALKAPTLPNHAGAHYQPIVSHCAGPLRPTLGRWQSLLWTRHLTLAQARHSGNRS